mmetsp:Transcript_7468/g.27417  ORF Transcript_7468/g.27417 Transcript_7468/m.27417 type:complete len:257 (+) Transcript_7468:615-1385(+)
MPDIAALGVERLAPEGRAPRLLRRGRGGGRRLAEAPRPGRGQAAARADAAEEDVDRRRRHLLAAVMRQEHRGHSVDPGELLGAPNIEHHDDGTSGRSDNTGDEFVLAARQPHVWLVSSLGLPMAICSNHQEARVRFPRRSHCLLEHPLLPHLRAPREARQKAGDGNTRSCTGCKRQPSTRATCDGQDAHCSREDSKEHERRALVLARSLPRGNLDGIRLPHAQGAQDRHEIPAEKLPLGKPRRQDEEVVREEAEAI